MKIVNHNNFEGYDGCCRVILFEYDKDGSLKIMHQYDAASFVQGVHALIFLDSLHDAAKIVIERSDLIK